MAVNLDIIIIQVSQVSRDYSRNEVLDLYAGKGSGAIENASRKVIGLNGQSKSPETWETDLERCFKLRCEWRVTHSLNLNLLHLASIGFPRSQHLQYSVVSTQSYPFIGQHSTHSYLLKEGVVQYLRRNGEKK